MPQPLLLSGTHAEVIDPLAEHITELEEEVTSLKAELETANLRAAQAEARAKRGVSRLRQQLSPLYSALCEVFDEMDRVSPAGNAAESSISAAAPSIDSRQRAIWDSWKRKIGGRSADAIEALLLHGEMTPQGVAVAIGIHPNNVAKVMYKLNQAGILRKNGRNYALKTQ